MPKGIYKRTIYHRKINSDSHKGHKKSEKECIQQSKITKKMWKNKEYRNKVSNGVSNTVKKLWNNKIYRAHQDKNTIDKHHIYLKENSDKILKLNKSIHRKVHLRAYEGIYELFGKRGIDRYLKWFDKKYGGL